MTTLRKTLGALLALGAAGAAQADIAPYSSGDGSLYFNLLDVTNQRSYVLDLNTPISTFNAASSYTFNADPLLSNFLTTGSGNYIWSVFGGDSTGDAAGSDRYFTTSTNLATAALPNNNRLNSLYGSESMLSSINALIDDTTNSLVSNSTDATFYTQAARTWNNTNDFVANQTGFGSVGFFSLTTTGPSSAFSGGNNPVARVAFGDWTFTSEGVLSYGSSTPVVPLPAAFWLLASGLLGMAGVARRTTKEA